MTPLQSRAARAILRWTLDVLADKSALSRQALHDFENEKTSPHRDTLLKIQNAFEISGIDLIAGGARLKQDIVQIYEGVNCYSRILDDAIRTLGTGDEFLASASDERRSPKEVIEKLRFMRRSGIRMRSLIRNGDTYIMGLPEEYRWMPDDLFVDGDVKVIFGDSIAYLMSWLGIPRVVKITNRNVAEENQRMFNHIWYDAVGPAVSTSEVFYDKGSL